MKDKLRPPSFAVPDQQKISNLSSMNLSHASSVSCLVNSAEPSEVHADQILLDSHSPSSLLTSVDAIAEKLVSTKHSFMEQRNCRDNNISPIDSDESVMGSNPPTPKNLTLKPSETKPANHHLNSPNRKLLQPPRKSKRLLNFVGDNPQRCVVPVGPMFQADIPVWNGLLDRRIIISQYKRKTANSKWLGNRVWPTEARTVKNTGKTIGSGRPHSCHCVSPGSVDCIKRHCLEARLFLQSDIGPAFFSWKFDEMGIQVSKSWMLKDQQTFESIMKIRPSSNGRNFLNNALKSIPQKSRKDVVSYYFNVYLPGQISLQTRSLSIKVVDTDDESEVVNSRKRSEKPDIEIKSKKAKAQYLRPI